jgi:hypothetical protein
VAEPTSGPAARPAASAGGSWRPPPALAAFADLDADRTARRGYPEAVFCEGKSVEQVRVIAATVREREARTLFTRVLPEQVAALLAELPDAAHVADARLATYPTGADGSIFTTSAGTPVGHMYYEHQLFRSAVASAGLPVGTTSHDLRHHFASLLLAAGESGVAVAERLGHDDASLVLSTYGHLMPDSEDRTRRAVDAAWGVARQRVPQMCPRASGRCVSPRCRRRRERGRSRPCPCAPRGRSRRR